MPAWQVCAEGQSPFAGLPQRNSTALVEFNRAQRPFSRVGPPPSDGFLRGSAQRSAGALILARRKGSTPTGIVRQESCSPADPRPLPSLKGKKEKEESKTSQALIRYGLGCGMD